jgi:hypothetical protein
MQMNKQPGELLAEAAVVAKANGWNRADWMAVAAGEWDEMLGELVLEPPDPRRYRGQLGQ